jgi:hypothetical protein
MRHAGSACLCAAGAAHVHAELLRQHDVSGPRYTSCPTAERFTTAFGADDHTAALRARAEGSDSDRARSLVKVDATTVEMTAVGWYFVRSIAMVFDRRLQADRCSAGCSRVL